MHGKGNYMPNMKNFENPPKRKMYYYVLVDNSKNTLSANKNELKGMLKALEEVLIFKTDTNYVEGIVSIITGNSEYTLVLDKEKNKTWNLNWEDIGCSEEFNFENALNILYRKLRYQQFSMYGEMCFYMPVIFCVVGSIPKENYMTSMEKLNGFRWFKRSTKVGINVNIDADIKALELFTGTEETVLSKETLWLMPEIVRCVDVHVQLFLPSAMMEKVGIYFQKSDEITVRVLQSLQNLSYNSEDIEFILETLSGVLENEMEKGILTFLETSPNGKAHLFVMHKKVYVISLDGIWEVFEDYTDINEHLSIKNICWYENEKLVLFDADYKEAERFERVISYFGDENKFPIMGNKITDKSKYD